ncbi:transposase [Thermoplasma sp. Kam2015]|uniref:RNA-guided endonuclease InsQ/TnpB family protein n=1 Tax=Thermoplasma sp. Kam2015 TaxID=2094122 RepID=UPI000D968087|nr:RNA-guided endonuclease TnpB family protein [Thermoplasma sp. Kam2015]PYB68791.1 transposase [Thermoplasma sp. Kam2015]
MKTMRTEQIFIRDNGVISRMCHVSKNLYNQVNYILRNQFFNREKLSSYGTLAKQFSKPSDIEENNNFQKLPAQTAQWTIKKVKESWNYFFRALKTYKKHPELFDGIPKPPKYKNKDGEFILIFTNQQCSIDNGILKFPKIMDLEVKTRLDDNTDLREVRIIPLGVGYNVEIVYVKEISDVSELSPKRIQGIDIGVMNIVTIGNNISEKGIAVKGGVLKSINQYFNKELSRLRSISDRQIGSREMTKKERKLFMKRNRKIKDIMHKLSRSIVEYALSRKIDTIVIGHNDGWKQSVDIGKKNNQNFVQIPFNMLIQQIKYKAEEKGINVMIQEESYTSICSFLDNESIEHHNTYMGKRIKRGVFQSANGTLIHADLNASYNTIRKAIPEAFDGIEGIGLYPRSLSIKEMITSKGGC